MLPLLKSQLETGLLALPGQPQCGLQQSQYRVVNPDSPPSMGGNLGPSFITGGASVLDEELVAVGSHTVIGGSAGKKSPVQRPHARSQTWRSDIQASSQVPHSTHCEHGVWGSSVLRLSSQGIGSGVTSTHTGPGGSLLTASERLLLSAELDTVDSLVEAGGVGDVGWTGGGGVTAVVPGVEGVTLGVVAGVVGAGVDGGTEGIKASTVSPEPVCRCEHDAAETKEIRAALDFHARCMHRRSLKAEPESNPLRPPN